jgi:hypothetical protein
MEGDGGATRGCRSAEPPAHLLYFLRPTVHWFLKGAWRSTDLGGDWEGAHRLLEGRWWRELGLLLVGGGGG